MANKVQAEFEVTSTDKGGTLKRRRKELDQLGSSYEKTSKASQRAASAAAEHDYKQSQGVRGTASAGRNMSKLAQTIDGPNGLVQAYATLAANAFAVSAAFGALREAKQTEIVMKGLEIQGARTGRTLSLVAKSLQEISMGGLSGTQAMQVTALGTAAGFTRKDLEALVGVANDAAAALGRNLPDSVDRIIKGVTKLEPELLDELGIMTKLGEAQDKYAKELNKTAASLTSFEKRQAMLNAVIAEGTLKYDGLTEAIGGNPYDRIAASFDSLIKSFSSGVTSVLELSGVLTLLGSNMNALVGTVVLFGSTIIPNLLGQFGILADTSAKNALAARKDAAAQKERTQSYLAGARAAIDQAKANAKLGSENIQLSKKAQAIVPLAVSGDPEKTNAALKTLTASVRGYEGSLTRLKKAGVEATDPKYLQVEANKKATQSLIENLEALKRAEAEYTRNSQQLGASRIEQFSAQQVANKETAKANAIYAASNLQVGTALSGVSTSVKSYSKELVVNQIQMRQQAKIAGTAPPTYGLFAKAMDSAKVASYGLGLGLRTAGTAILAIVPYIGMAIAAWGLLQEIVDKYFRTDAEREKIKAYEELGTVIESTKKKIEELQKITEAEGNTGKRAIQAITLRSNAIAELAASYDKANRAAIEAGKAEEQATKVTQNSIKVRQTTFEVLAGTLAGTQAKLIGGPMVMPTIDETVAANNLRFAKRYAIAYNETLEDIKPRIEIVSGGDTTTEELKSLAGAMQQLSSLAPDIYEDLLQATKGTKSFGEASLLTSRALERADRIYGELAQNISNFTTATEGANTAQKDLLKSISVQTPYDAAFDGFSELSKIISTLDVQLAKTPANLQQLENLGNVLSTLPSEISNLLDKNTKQQLETLDTLNKQLETEKQKLEVLKEQGAEEADIKAQKTVIESSTANILKTSREISVAVQDNVESYTEQLHQARLLSIEGQSQITLAQAKLAVLQRQGALTAEDVRKQIEAENNIVRAQAQQLSFNKLALENQANIVRQKLQDLRVGNALAIQANAALNTQKKYTAEIILQSREVERSLLLQRKSSGTFFTPEEEERLKKLNVILNNRANFIQGFNESIAKQNDEFAAQQRAFAQSEKDLIRQVDIAEAQARNVGAQIDAILTRIISDSEILTAETRKNIENNAENNALLNEAANLADQNRRTTESINNLLDGRNSQLLEELNTLRSQFEERKRTIILEKAATIAQLENEKRQAQANKQSSAVEELDTRIRLQKELLAQQLEDAELTTIRELAQKALNGSITDGVEKQQEALNSLRKQIELSSSLLSQEKEIALTRARISAKLLGTELSPEAQQAIEFAAARRELKLAQETFNLKISAIDAEYDLLEAQRMATAAELKIRTALLEETYRVAGGATPEQLNTLSQIRNAADLFSSQTYAAARELAKAQERNALTILELRAEELSIFGGSANSLTSRMVSASKQAALVYRNILSGANEKVSSPMEKAVSVIRPDLNSLEASLDRNVKDMTTSMAETIKSFATLNVNLENLAKIIELYSSTPRSGDRVMSEISAPGGRRTSAYGMRTHHITGQKKFHAGVDIAGRTGDPIESTMGGVVSFAGEMGGYGKVVKVLDTYIEDGVKKTVETLYAHMSEILVKQGQRVERGGLLGKVGSTGRSTGPHLHYEVRVNGKLVNPDRPVQLNLTTDSMSRPSYYTPGIGDGVRGGEVIEPKIKFDSLPKAVENLVFEPIRSGLQDIEVPPLDLKMLAFASSLDSVSVKLGAFTAAAKTQFAPLIEEMQKLGPEGELGATVASGMLNILDTVTNNTQIISEQLTTLSDTTLSGAQKFEAYANIASAALATVAGLLSTVSSIASASADAKIAAIDREIAAEQKRDGKSSQSLAKIEAMEKKKDSIAKKQFNTNKKLSMAQAVIATAVGVTEALKLGPIAGPILAAMIGAMGAAQLAIIAGTSYQSSYSPSSSSMPSTLSIGKRGENVNLAQGPSQIAGGEVGYLRGARGTGTSAADYRTVGSAYGGDLMRGYGNRGFVVGEKGPEVITPKTPLSVTPANEVQQGQPINATINIQALDSSDVKRVLVDQRGNIISMLREAANANGQNFLEDVNVNVYTRPQVGKL